MQFNFVEKCVGYLTANMVYYTYITLPTMIPVRFIDYVI
jgi:hypothetical protein